MMKVLFLHFFESYPFHWTSHQGKEQKGAQGWAEETGQAHWKDEGGVEGILKWISISPDSPRTETLLSPERTWATTSSSASSPCSSTAFLPVCMPLLSHITPSFSFDGVIVAKLPFQAAFIFKAIMHRNLPGKDLSDCSFVFFFRSFEFLRMASISFATLVFVPLYMTLSIQRQRF